jgi:ribosomal protein S27AE
VTEEDDPLARRMECDNGCGVTLHRDSLDSTEDRWKCTKCGEISWSQGSDEVFIPVGEVPGPPPIPVGPRVMIVDLPEGYKDHPGYPWKDGDAVLFLGEILNMPGGHCAVVSKDGTVNWAFHTDNFREPTEDEI